MRVVTTNDLVGEAANRIAARIADVAARRPRVSVALSGGSTPWQVFTRLAQMAVPWEAVDIFQVDERIVGPEHPDRNLTRLRATLVSGVPASMHPMPVDDADLDAAAERYSSSLPERFDLIHLGLGADGHTASLIPGDPVLDVTDRTVAVTEPYLGHRRMTLTYPVLDRAAALLWIVGGESKRGPLAKLLRHDPGIPAGRVSSDRAVVITDLADA